MNTTNFTVEKTSATKVVITISLRAIWENVMSSLTDMGWDDPNAIQKSMEGFTHLLKMSKESPVDFFDTQLRKLFRDGYTCLMLGEGMCEFEKDVLRQVKVCYNDHTTIINHEDINF